MLLDLSCCVGGGRAPRHRSDLLQESLSEEQSTRRDPDQRRYDESRISSQLCCGGGGRGDGVCVNDGESDDGRGREDAQFIVLQARDIEAPSLLYRSRRSYYKIFLIRVKADGDFTYLTIISLQASSLSSLRVAVGFHIYYESSAS